MSGNKSQFATRFEKAHQDAGLPEVYRRFILDGTYIEYKTSFIQGLMNRGPTYTEVKWDDQVMLNLEEMYDERDIELAGVPYHPIATIRYTDEFLAIDPTDENCAVYIWTHEDGNFHQQFDSFDELLREIRTKAQMTEEKARIRKLWSEIKKQCKPALNRALKHYDKGDLEKAKAEIGSGLDGREPIEYTGPDTDYDAIQFLAELYNLQGLIALQQDRRADAVKSFADSCECRLCTPALIHAIIAYSFSGDVPTAYAIALRSRALPKFKPGAGNEGYHIDPEPWLSNFSVDQLDKAKQVLEAFTGTDEETKFAKQVLNWLNAG